MGISITQDLEGNLEQQPPELESTPPTPPVIQPTPSPATPPIDPAFVDLMRYTIAEQNRQIAELQRGALEVTRTPATPPKTDDEDRQEYFANPKQATRNLIREEMQATIQPIADFVQSLKAGSQVDNLVNKFKIDPRYKDHWSPGVESYIREQAATVTPDRLNDSTFAFIVVSALGSQLAGLIPNGRAPAPTSTPQPPAPMPTPPFIPSSPPAGPAPRAGADAPTRQLNEQEQRILREYNATKPKDKQMTPAQYIKWQEMDAGDVATYEGDRARRA